LCEGGTTVLFSSHQLDLVEHLCEDVVILDKGHVVLAGRLSELRAAAPRRRVEIALARDAGERWWECWTPRLPGVEVAGGDARRVRLSVDRSVDLAKVLTEATQAAEVVRFDFEPPSLSEIFREAVRP
jgi:ABC-2 type transport system ATP-binding protein